MRSPSLGSGWLPPLSADGRILFAACGVRTFAYGSVSVILALHLASLGLDATAIGIFLPVYVLTIVPAPWFMRHRDNAPLRAFVQGATASATGAIAGAVVVLGLRSIFDIPTALIGLVGLGLLWRFKLQEPILVSAAGLAGPAVWPLVRGGA